MFYLRCSCYSCTCVFFCVPFLSASFFGFLSVCVFSLLFCLCGILYSCLCFPVISLFLCIFFLPQCLCIFVFPLCLCHSLRADFSLQSIESYILNRAGLCNRRFLTFTQTAMHSGSCSYLISLSYRFMIGKHSHLILDQSRVF